MSVGAVEVIVPDWIDDPARPSGGNTYDRRICSGLAARDREVRIHRAAGHWPCPAPSDLTRLAAVLDRIPDGAVVLVDGLIGSAAGSVLVARASRLRFVVLVHLPLGLGGTVAGAGHDKSAAEGERSVLAAVPAVITTSRWTRGWLLERYGLDPGAVHTAVPGVDAADVTAPTPGGDRLLCVAAVTPVKGHDVLLGALAALDDMPWRLTCVGSMSEDPGFVDGLRRRFGTEVAGRVEWRGPLTGSRLATEYALADLLLVPSRLETYGMVAGEAMARGIPVIGSAVGGLPEALGAGPDGGVPGMLVPVGDPHVLCTAVRRWLCDTSLRHRLRASALGRRPQLRSWAATAADVSAVLDAVAPERSLAAGTR